MSDRTPPTSGSLHPVACLPPRRLEDNLAAQLTTHPDTHIYASLPRVKTLRTARLLAEIGDARSEAL